MRNKGITLIGLVITIIALLILAGVSITMTLGENGVLSQAAKAQNDTAVSEEKEMIELAYSTLKTDVMTGETPKITANDLQSELNKMYGEEKVIVTGLNVLTVKYITSQREYILDTNGKFLESLPIEEVLSTASKHPDQILTEDIGVAEDGTQVNLDLWSYTKVEKYYNIGGGYQSGYDNNNIVDGKIQGKVPRYIKEAGGEFYEVSYICFWGCTNLVVAPDLPNSITSLKFAFYDCTNLEIVENFPDNLVSLRETFYDCTNLKKVAEIPNTVTNMSMTFRGCTNLTGTLKINANPTPYDRCFNNASTAEGTNLVLVGNGTNDEAITNLYNTKSENSNITIVE